MQTVGQLVQMTENQLLSLRSFGKTSLDEVNEKLTQWGLSLGMTSAEVGMAPAPL